jgi:Bacterial transcriptional activator domain
LQLAPEARLLPLVTGKKYSASGATVCQISCAALGPYELESPSANRLAHAGAPTLVPPNSSQPERPLLARVLREGDPCDEEASELTVRAFAAIGDVASAEAEYRRYAATLKRELHARPSNRFAEYVAALKTARR